MTLVEIVTLTTPFIIGGVGLLVETSRRANKASLDAMRLTTNKALQSLEKSVEECVADTKDCNKSIASLAQRAAVTDSNVDSIRERVEQIAKQSGNLVERVTAVETRQNVARGAD